MDTIGVFLRIETLSGNIQAKRLLKVRKSVAPELPGGKRLRVSRTA